jgi:rhodanese-related sulfurtransferase
LLQQQSTGRIVYISCMKNAIIYLAFCSLVFLSNSALPQSIKADEYQCTPCGGECDNETYNKPGTCSHCHMVLVKKSGVAFKNIPVNEICDYIAKHPSVVLLDVRTKGEFEGRHDNYGTLKNAINIPIRELENRVTELEKYKNSEIVVYCSHSQRSPQASHLLTQRGFTKVFNLSGGMSVMKDNSCKK